MIMASILIGLVAGYGLGHLRGQCVGIKWCEEINRKYDGIDCTLPRADRAATPED